MNLILNLTFCLLICQFASASVETELLSRSLRSDMLANKIARAYFEHSMKLAYSNAKAEMELYLDVHDNDAHELLRLASYKKIEPEIKTHLSLVRQLKGLVKRNISNSNAHEILATVELIGLNAGVISNYLLENISTQPPSSTLSRTARMYLLENVIRLSKCRMLSQKIGLSYLISTLGIKTEQHNITTLNNELESNTNNIDYQINIEKGIESELSHFKKNSKALSSFIASFKGKLKFDRIITLLSNDASFASDLIINLILNDL